MNVGLLKVINISKSYIQGNSVIPVLTRVSAAFEQGKSYAVMGRSGSGKSTLLHLIAGFDVPDMGSVSINGISHGNLEFMNLIGIVFQRPYLIYELSVLENIVIKKIIQNSLQEADIMYAKDLLEEIGLSHIINTPCYALSGGEQQRVALLRALFTKPQFLLADEPTAHVDDDTAKKIIELLLMYKQKYNLGLIVVTHDKNLAHHMDIQYFLEQGTLNFKE